MIYRSETEITGIYRDSRVITAVYRGVRLVWELITSCFGRGYWINSAPYKNDDGWKNN